MGGGCSGAEEAVGGTPSSATVALQSLSSKLLSWPSTCEKLERWLVSCGTTLINRVDVGPKGGGGGGGGAGGGMGIAVVGVVGAEHFQLVLSLYLRQLESHQLSFKKVAYLVSE